MTGGYKVFPAGTSRPASLGARAGGSVGAFRRGASNGANGTSQRQEEAGAAHRHDRA